MRKILKFLDDPRFRQILVALGPIVINGVLGMTEGYSSIILPQLQRENSTIKVDNQLSSMIASAGALPMAAGSLLGGFLMEIIGRKAIHIWSCVPLIFGWFLIAFAPNAMVIILGRLLTGLSDGLLGPPSGVYIAETSHPNIRGVLIMAMSVSIAAGVLAIHILGTFFTWRLSSLISGLIPVPFVILLFFVPESPTFLAKKGRIEEATKAFYWCRGNSSESNKELKELIERQKDLNNAPKLSMADQMKYFRDPKFWKPTVIISVLFFTAQISGNNAVASYAISIIRECGLSGEAFDEYLAMVVMGSVRVIASIMSCILVLKMTRRNLMKLSGFGVCLTLLILCCCLYFAPDTAVKSPLMVLTMLITYVFFIAVGLVPLSWTMMGEIFPLAYRGLGTAITSCVCYVFLYLVVQTFPYLLVFFGSIIGVLALYCACTLFGTVILTLFLPETKDKPLYEIEDSFVSKKNKKKFKTKDIPSNIIGTAFTTQAQDCASPSWSFHDLPHMTTYDRPCQTMIVTASK